MHFETEIWEVPFHKFLYIQKLNLAYTLKNKNTILFLFTHMQTHTQPLILIEYKWKC